MGYDFADIALLLGKRNRRQIAMRYRVLKFRKISKMKPWTEYFTLKFMVHLLCHIL